MGDRVCLGCGLAAGDTDESCPRCEGTLAHGAAIEEAAATTLPPDVAHAAQHPDNCFGSYIRIRLLGTGASGEVWLGWHRGLRRQVALKLMTLLGPHAEPSPDQAMAQERFLHEAGAIARLRHPRIVAVHDAGLAEFGGIERLYIAMDFLPGGTFASDKRSLRDQVAVIADVADALAHAHDHGVVHRDVKPANVLLDGDGRGCLSDFGLARVTDGTLRTASGMIMGTPGYMSPEQAGGEGHRADGRSDLYSLGVMLYQRLAGRLPHDASSTMELVAKIVSETPVAPHRIRPDADRALEAICLRAMAKEPSQRFATAAEMAADLRRWLAGEPVYAAAPGLVSRLGWRLKRRWRTVVSALALVALAASATMLIRRSPSEPEWVVVYQADGPVGSEWIRKRGSLTLHEGALCARNAHSLLDADFGEQVRIEYEATAQPDAGEAKELSCFMAGSPDRGLEQGYSFEVGIELGTKHAIQRLHWVTWGKPLKQALEKARTYQVVAERRLGALSLTLDGVEMVAAIDPTPLTGNDHTRAGIGTQCSHLHYAKFRILVPPGDAERAARSMAERGHAALAAAAFESLEKSMPDEPSRMGARLQRIRALASAGREEDALREAEAIRASSRDDEVIVSALDAQADILVRRGDGAVLWRRLLESWPKLGVAAEARARGLHTRLLKSASEGKSAADLYTLLLPIARLWREAAPNSLIALDVGNLCVMAALASGNCDGALDELKHVDESYLIVKFILVSHLVEAGRNTEAESVLGEAVRELASVAPHILQDEARESMAALESLARRATRSTGTRVLSVTDACFERPSLFRTAARLSLAAAALAEKDVARARHIARDLGSLIETEGVGEYSRIWNGEDPPAALVIRKEAEFLRGLRALSEGSEELAKAHFERYLASPNRGDYRVAVRIHLKP